MADAVIRLSIDLWHTTLAAAVSTADGRVMPIAIDGAAVSPSGVAVDADGRVLAGREGARIGHQTPGSYVRMPGQALFDTTVRVGAADLDPVDVLAAALSTVARETRLATGTIPADVVISTPAGWVARQRHSARTAAERAGLGQARLVTGAESILREQIARGSVIPAGSVVVVCRLDSTAGELVLLRRDPDTVELLATVNLGELGEVPGTTMAEQAAAALTAAMDATGVTGDQLTAVFCHAPTAAMAELTAAIAPAPSLPGAVSVAEMAAAFGGARPTQLKAGPTQSRPPWGRVVGAGISATIAWSAAALLTFQVVSSATLYPATSVSQTTLVSQWYGWGLAPVFATLGAVSLALAGAHLRAVRSRATWARPDPALGSVLIAVAVLGLGGAGALGLIGAAHFGIGPAPLLRWTLFSSGPLAVVLIALGSLVARVSPPADAPVPWRDRLRFPLSALVGAAVSAVTVVASYVAVPAVDSDLWWTMEHLGAFVLGWAVALLLAADPWRRVILGFLLGSTAAYAIRMQTADVLFGCLIAAITLWWLLKLVPVIVTLPRRRLVPTDMK